MQVTLELGQKILGIVDAGLVIGAGRPEPGYMCVEAAICYALGEPHGDQPSCTAVPDGAFKIRLNDSQWSSDMERARGMRLLAIAQIGTVGTQRRAWVDALVRETIRRIVPMALLNAAKRVPAHAARLEDAAVRCARDADRAAVLEARSVTAVAAAAAAADDAAAERDRVLNESAACALTAYRETGSPGYDLLIDMGLVPARGEEANRG